MRKELWNLSVHSAGARLRLGLQRLHLDREIIFLIWFLVMRKWSTRLPLLTGPLCLELLVPGKVPSTAQIKLFNPFLCLKPFYCARIKLLVLDRNT